MAYNSQPVIVLRASDSDQSLGVAMFIAQTLAEYGILASIAAGIAAARNRIEVVVGSGNLKYLLLVAIAFLILLLAKRRRGGA